ncbi:MAG: DUF4340 domain-containing protein [Cyclobacteriaceae bacterium]|nr:DUF4340 domain-containing protein [Cyclobacteriaceae bacterium]
MQEKKNIRLLISLFAISGVCILLIFFGGRNERADVDKNLFKMEDQTQVNKIILSTAGKNQEIEIRYDGTKWIVNNSFEADNQLITVFFATLLQAEPKRPVAETLQDSIAERMQKQGIRVTLFEGETAVKDFWVSGNDQRTETYFQLAGDKTSYLVTIPGYRVFVASLFELSEVEWRDKRIFNFNWQNFKTLKVHFPQQSNQDFTISFANTLFGIEEVAVADTTKLSTYLESVFNLRVDQYNINSTSRYDSLLKTAPVYSITISDIVNRTYQVEVFPPLKGEQVILGRLNENLSAFFSLKQIAQISRKRSYFEY